MKMQARITRTIGCCGAAAALCLLSGCGDGGGGGGGTAPQDSELRVSGRALVLEPQGKVLAKRVTVQMPFTDNDLAELGLSDPSGLEVYEYDSSWDRWEKVRGATVDIGRSQVTFTTMKLTMFRFAAKSD